MWPNWGYFQPCFLGKREMAAVLGLLHLPVGSDSLVLAEPSWKGVCGRQAIPWGSGAVLPHRRSPADKAGMLVGLAADPWYVAPVKHNGSCGFYILSCSWLASITEVLVKYQQGRFWSHVHKLLYVLNMWYLNLCTQELCFLTAAAWSAAFSFPFFFSPSFLCALMLSLYLTSYFLLFFLSETVHKHPLDRGTVDIPKSLCAIKNVHLFC